MAFLRIVRNHIDLSHFDETMAVINAERRSGVEARAPGLQYRFVAYDPSSGDGLISTVGHARAGRGTPRHLGRAARQARPARLLQRDAGRHGDRPHVQSRLRPGSRIRGLAFSVDFATLMARARRASSQSFRGHAFDV